MGSSRNLAVGEAESPGSLLIGANEVDLALDQIQRGLNLNETCSPQGICVKVDKIDGLLGWTFLREFRVSLAEGLNVPLRRFLNLTRLPTQTHWMREYVGFGIYAANTESPTGLRVDGFMPSSSLREAGALLGDVITTVNGVSIRTLAAPYGTVGSTVTLGIARGSQTLSLQAEVRDMLPDPAL
jgi:S1-C subfamily serine protease